LLVSEFLADLNQIVIALGNNISLSGAYVP